MVKNIQITRASTLRDLERFASDASGESGEIQIWLPAELGPQFFKETRFTSLLATAAANHPTAVVDWIERSNDVERNRKRFGTTVEGLASVVLGSRIIDATGNRADFGHHDLLQEVSEREDIAEGDGRGASLTFCAIDKTVPAVPVAFAGMATKDAFIKTFVEYRHAYFDTGLRENYSSRAAPDLFDVSDQSNDVGQLPPDADKVLAGFVYELLQNSQEHGCLDSEGNLIKGLRYVRIRRHINFQKDAVLGHAEGFVELQEYLRETIPAKGQFGFYEISVSDHGLGIVDRFVATRPEYGIPEANLDERAGLVNRIISEALSSRHDKEGAGHGLDRVMKAVTKLRGFVSVRTDRLWLYRNSMRIGAAGTDVPLSKVADSAALAKIRGTQFNMLFPLV